MREPIGQYLAEARTLHKLRGWVCHSICQGTHLDGTIEFGQSAQSRGMSYTFKRFSLTEIRDAADQMPRLAAELSLQWSEFRAKHPIFG